MLYDNKKEGLDSLKYTVTYLSDGRMQVVGLPARIDREQTADLLGVRVKDLYALKRYKVLMPLGQTPKKGVKTYASTFYSLCDVCGLATCSESMHQAQHAISSWNDICKNGSKTKEG